MSFEVLFLYITMTQKTAILLTGRAGSGKTTAARILRVEHGAEEFTYAGMLKRVANMAWMDLYGMTDFNVRIADRRLKESPLTYGWAAREFWMYTTAYLCIVWVVWRLQMTMAERSLFLMFLFSTYAHGVMFLNRLSPRLMRRPVTPRRFLQWLGTDIFRSVDPEVWTRVVIRQARETDARNIVISDVRFPNECGETIRKQLNDAGFERVLVLRIINTTPGIPRPSRGAHQSEMYIDGLKVHADIENDHSLGVEPLKMVLADYMGQARFE